MPKLENERHEIFARGVASGLTKEAAYEKAGYKPAWHGSRLSKTPKVAARIIELHEEAIAGLKSTTQILSENADQARKLAVDSGHPNAAVLAIKEIGRLTGVRPTLRGRKKLPF